MITMLDKVHPGRPIAAGLSIFRYPWYVSTLSQWLHPWIPFDRQDLETENVVLRIPTG
jgi:hypothetical protein